MEQQQTDLLINYITKHVEMLDTQGFQRARTRIDFKTIL